MRELKAYSLRELPDVDVLHAGTGATAGAHENGFLGHDCATPFALLNCYAMIQQMNWKAYLFWTHVVTILVSLVGIMFFKREVSQRDQRGYLTHLGGRSKTRGVPASPSSKRKVMGAVKTE